LNYFNPEEYEIIASGRRQTDFFAKRGIEYYSVDITNEQDFNNFLNRCLPSIPAMIEKIHFNKMSYRKDIGYKALKSNLTPNPSP